MCSALGVTPSVAPLQPVSLLLQILKATMQKTNALQPIPCDHGTVQADPALNLHNAARKAWIKLGQNRVKKVDCLDAEDPAKIGSCVKHLLLTTSRASKAG
jgi:hypothetical protein